MAISFPVADRRPVELSWGEVTGAVGDSITVLPIVVAVALRTRLSLTTILLGFAVFQVVWGLYYGLPISVEPMKALSVLVIAGTLSPAEFVGAGLLAGVVLLIAGRTRLLSSLERYVDRSVVRGVQVAVALILLRTGLDLAVADPWLAGSGVLVACLAVALGHRRAGALAVLGVGAAFAGLQVGVPDPSLPTVTLVAPAAAFGAATLEGLAAQLAMTVGNAAVATSLLLSDYFDADVRPDDLATTMGAMNLLAVPLGAMPMCHGSGGVAGKYAFGARTAGANLILGGLYAAAAVLAAEVVAAFPMAMLGVVLALVAGELGRAGLDGERPRLALLVGVVGLASNVGVALVVGALASPLAKRFV